MSTINYTYNVIVDRFRQFADGHFQLRRFTHGEISQADLEKEAEWPWMHVKPRAINYSPGTRAFSFEIFISDLPRDKEDKTGYQAESITDCSLIFQDLINEIHLGQMFGDDVVLTRPVNSEPFVEQYTHTLTGVTGIIELSLDYDWSACSIPASWNYNTPTNSPNDGFGALQFIESLHQDGVFVSLDNDQEAPGNSYYYGTNASGVKGWYAIVDNIGLTCETLPDCAVIISIEDDIAALQTDVALKANTADLGATAFSNDYNDLDNLPTIPDVSGFVPYTGATQDVDLGTHNLTADHIGLNVSPSGAGFVVGATQWNNTIGSSETLLKGGIVSLKNGVDLVARVVNKVTPNTTLTKAAYQAVRVSGAQGQRLAVAFAQANNDNNSADTIGLVCETIATNQEGFIQTVGQLEDINTTGSLQGETWADGDVLYLSPTTAGALTNIKPTGATGHIVIIGYVEYAHANNGKIYVKIMNGWELDELHNVYITSPANNQGLFYDSSDQLWKNETIASALGYTPFNLPSLTSGSVLFSNGTTIAQDNANLFWDDTNNRLGIGTASPAVKFTVQQSNQAYAQINNTDFDIALGIAANTALIGGMDFKNFNSAGQVRLLARNNSDDYVAINTYGSTATGTLFGINRTNIHAVFGQGAFEPSKKLVVGTFNAGDLILGTNNVERMRVFAGGNVAIGTTTDAGFKLDVNGTARVQGNAQFGTGFYWDNTNGRLGIGTASPASRLHVGTSVGTLATGLTFGSGVSGIYLLDNTTMNISINSANRFWFRSTDFYPDVNIGIDLGLTSRRWKTLNTQQITDNGTNVLIGTTTDAGYKLDVNGTARVVTSITTAQFRLSALNTAPASATATGTLGEIRIDASYIYVCTATNTWKRSAITTW
jgi:hypothetical protein